MVLPPIRRRAILGIAVLGGLLLLVVAVQAASRAIEAQWRADLEEKVQFRDAACACQTLPCARRVARTPAFGASSVSGEAHQAHIDGFLCLSRFSYTCTLGDLLKDHDEATMRRLQEHYFRVRR